MNPLTIPESEADADAILDQDDVPLSQENSTKKIRLTRQTLNQIKQTDIRTVGELLQWIESGKPSTPTPGLESISEIKGRLAQAKALDESETEVDTNTSPDQNDISLSPEDSSEKSNLTQHSPNQSHIESQTSREGEQQVKSSEPQTISEVEADIDAIPDQNDGSLSPEDSTEGPSLTQHSPNQLIHTDSQAAGEVTQQVESAEIQTVSESTANTNTILEQNDVYLSRGDAIEKLNLSQRSLKALKRADIRMVGELLQRVELGKIRVTRGLGRKSIPEIEKKLAQVKIYDNYIHLSREDSITQLYLRNRSFNALTHAGVQTIGEALQLVESDGLKRIPALGRKSIVENKK